MTDKPLRFGVIGAANIARAFIAGVKPSRKVAVAAVASRDAAKARAFADETGVARSHGSYEALLDDPEIDAFYIPLPNSMHAEWVIRAAERGKPILCEKPLSVSAEEARAMFAAARRNKIVLAEGFPYMAQAHMAKVRSLIAEGAIGKPKLIRSTFGLTSSDFNNIRLSPTLGGGCLLDAGSYATSFIRIVAGERPTRVNATARYASNGVDITAAATIEFPSGLIAQMSCSFETGYHRHGLVAGTDGVIETNYLNHPPASGPAVLQIKRGIAFNAVFEPIPVADANGFLLEAESFADYVAKGPQHWTGATEAESVEIMATLDAIRESAKSGNWVDVKA